jgi:spoIIIJ-associated protein
MNGKPADATRQREEAGRTVDEAVERAAKALGVRRDDLTIEVLDDGSRGVFGIGARDARVRVTVTEGTRKVDRSARESRTTRGTAATTRVSPDRSAAGSERSAADVAREASERLLALMGFEATVEVQDSEGTLKLDVKGENLAGLIGKHGQTLAALEMLIGQMIGREISSAPHVEMDVEGYRERRRQALEALARRAAARVLREKREIALDPMTPRERRIVHTTLQGHPGVATVSRGEGEVRRVVVILRRDERNAAVDTSPTAEPSAERQPATRREGSPTGRTGNASQGRDRSRDRFNARGSRRRERQPRSREYSDSPGTPLGSGHAGRDRDNVRSRSGSQLRGGYSQGFGPGYGSPRRPSGRPEGLPSDEELEAEIQAHLEKVRNDRSARAAQDTERVAPESRTAGAADRPPSRGDAEE